MRAEPCPDCGVLLQPHAAGCFTAAVERGEITARERQVQISLRARERQVDELREQEARLGRCPSCKRAGRRLGDHDCDAAFAIDEARERIQSQDGAVCRGAKITNLVIDELNGAIAQQGRIASAAKVSAAAMKSLTASLGVGGAAYVDGAHVGEFKGMKISVDPALPDDTLVMYDENAADAFTFRAGEPWCGGYARALSFEETARRLYGVPPHITGLDS